MDNHSKSNLIKSGIIALVFSLLLPALIIGVFGTSYKTPTVEKNIIESMTTEERNEWIKNNEKKVSVLKHMKNIPEAYAKHWKSYIPIMILFFFIVFIGCGIYMQLRKKYET